MILSRKLFTFLLLVLAFPLLGEEKTKLEKFQPPKAGFWETVSNLFIPHYEKSNIVYEKESTYFLITVEDSETGYRSLIFNPKKGSQSTVKFDAPEAVIPKFMQYSFISLTAVDQAPKKALFIGLGAGIMPMFLRRLYPNTEMDIVEIDPAIAPIAKKYFGFAPDSKMKVIIKDGRVYVNNAKEKYDLIFIDAYSAKAIPFQLTTLEFYQQVKHCLKPKGIMVANIANFGKMDFIFREFETVRNVFANFAVFVCPGQTNFVIFASAKSQLNSKSMFSKAKLLDEKYDWNFKLTPFLQTRLPDDYLITNTKDVLLITDDRAGK